MRRVQDKVPQIPGLNGVEEKRPIVVHGANVERIRGVVGGAIRRKQQIAKGGSDVRSWCIDGLKSTYAGGSCHVLQIVAGEGQPRDQDGVLSAPFRQLFQVFTNDDDVPGSVVLAQPLECNDGERNHSQRFARRNKAPAGERHHTVSRQMPQIVSESIGGVQVVF